jgi:trigger factor
MDMKPEKFKSDLRSPSPSRREVELEVDAETVAQELERVVTEFASQAKVHGFRAGKAPKDLVKRLFSSEIRRSLIDALAPKTLGESLKSQNINPVNMPVITQLRYEEGQALHFTALFDVWPDFELPAYKKILIKDRTVSVEEEEIEKSLEDLRQKAAEYVPVEGRGVVNGDYVIAELQGKDLKTKRYLPTEKVVILAGQADNEKMLNETLAGMAVGEERHFVISYGQNHPQKKLAGKNVDYRIKVISLKGKQLPELNDDFAKTLGEYDGLNDLRKMLRKELEDAKDKMRRQGLGQELVHSLVEKLNVELPQSLVEDEHRNIIKETLESSRGQGPTQETVEQWKAEMKRRAEYRLKRHLILQRIGKSEKIDVSEEELDQEVRAIAKANNIPLAQVIETLSQEGRRESLRESLLAKKTVDFLLENAIIE